MLLGGSSGFLVFLARMRQKGMFSLIYKSMICELRVKVHAS